MFKSDEQRKETIAKFSKDLRESMEKKPLIKPKNNNK